MARAALTLLQLTDFRSYGRAELRLDGGSVFLFGPNGAGKTNLLEAVSLLTPGKGLRGSAMAEVGRRLPGEAQGRAWSVSVLLDTGSGDPVRLGTGAESAGAPRRVVRIEGETVQPGRLTEYLRLVWLTPAQDRLFLEGASERRKFFDRLVYAVLPDHAVQVAAYERALRERMRLLGLDNPPDPAWLSALEDRMAEHGAAMAVARAETMVELQREIDARLGRPFPQADLALTGEWERLAAEGEPATAIADRLRQSLARSRDRDAAAGRGLTGPHRGDLEVRHRIKDRAAAECSTGEQKAMILNLVLAQAARLSRAESAPNPILLLDEVAAHLDAERRGGLFDELEALGLQAFLTGVDEALFEDLAGRALGVRVDQGALTVTETA
jgi:DNA replication and repair protein RecF